MALHNRPYGDDEIRLIIAKAVMAVPLPSIKSDKEAPTTKGEQMKLMVENVRTQHDQIRRNILGQCPRTIPQSAVNDLRMMKFNSQRKSDNFAMVGQGILKLLQEPISRPEANPKFALPPAQPNQYYDKPLPTTQDYEMQPFLYELMPIMRALDTFNIQAAQQLRKVEEEKEKLERNGCAKIPLVVSRKRSASVANLDKKVERPPMKRSASGVAKPEERTPVKKAVSFAEAEQVLSVKRRENSMKPEYSSPRDRLSPRETRELPDRFRSPNTTAIRDPGLSNRDLKASREYGASSFPPTNGDSTSGKALSTNGGPSSSPNGNIHPSRANSVRFTLPPCPVKSGATHPQPSSRDPRLMNRKSSLKDR